MIDNRGFSILTLPLRHERHVVHARQRARDIAALLGFEHQEQIRLATAASELARNAFRYASGGSVEFKVRGHPAQLFLITVSDTGPGISNLAEILDGKYISQTGLGMGIVGTRRLMDHFKNRLFSRWHTGGDRQVIAGHSASGGLEYRPPHCCRTGQERRH